MKHYYIELIMTTEKDLAGNQIVDILKSLEGSDGVVEVKPKLIKGEVEECQ